MAVVHEHGDGDGGSSAAVVAIFLIALIVVLAILFYGFAVGHWFGVGGVTNVNVGTGGASASSAATAAASASAAFRPRAARNHASGKQKKTGWCRSFSCLFGQLAGLVREVFDHVDAGAADVHADADVPEVGAQNICLVLRGIHPPGVEVGGQAAGGCPDSQMMFSPYQLKATP